MSISSVGAAFLPAVANRKATSESSRDSPLERVLPPGRGMEDMAGDLLFGSRDRA